jgi:hypothetical protein
VIVTDGGTTSITETLATGIAGRPNDSSDQWQWDVARWESFYGYANESYARVQERWSAADEKAWKYLSILGIVIGAGALTSGQIARVFARPTTYLDGLFVCACIASAALVLASFICYLQALQLKALQAPPTGKEMLDFLVKTQHLEVLYNLGREVLAAADEGRIALEKKLKSADNGFQLMRLAGVCLLVAYLAFFWIQVREAYRDTATAASPTPADQRRTDK